MTKPIVGVISSHVVDDAVHYDRVRCRYLEAVATVGRCIPVMLPNVYPENGSVVDLLRAVDGILVTGDQTNVAASRYGQAQLESACNLDPARDQTVLDVIPAAIELGIPILGICRGLQEINVALDGSLHQSLSAHGGYIEHTEDDSLPRDEQYMPVHRVDLTGPVLAGILGSSTAAVNSLHNQGIDRLASDLRVEAVAPDGLVEAISVRTTKKFALAVQWHPEWFASSDAVSRKIFSSFGAAVHQRHENDRGRSIVHSASR